MKRTTSGLIALSLAVSLSGIATADDDLECTAELRGPAEAPDPVETRTRGDAEFEVDDDYEEIEYKLKIRRGQNVLGAAGAHVHCGRVGENGPVVAFLAGVHPGGLKGRFQVRGTITEQNILDPACGSTLEALVDAMAAGDTYVNVHSLDWPSGEVRGQIELDD
jgi:hypothetical protein